MRIVFKVLHLLGLALFLGSVAGHIVSSTLGGPVAATPAFEGARVHIAAATRWLTLPGLTLAVVTGLALATRAFGAHPRRWPRWLLVHASLAALVLAVSWVLVAPAGAAALEGIRLVQRGDGAGSLDAVASAKLAEDVLGTINVLCTIALVALAVARPWRRPVTAPREDAQAQGREAQAIACRHSSVTAAAR